VLHESLFKPLGELLRRKGIHNLVVVPQAELALVPYWELLETGQLSGAVCVAPSLNVHRMCTKQHRDGEGLTVLTPDITGSLLHSFAELRAVAERRSGEHRRCSTAREILDAAPSAAVLHIAAHGVFNADNPYLGGVIVNESEPADDWSRQYVAAPRRFSADMKPDAWPLMTVATCMANLRLDRCRLAVLSTCESGVPRLHGGGEMTGLPSALLLAGAKSVIASLWRVHDEATAVLMHHFYEVSTLGRGPIDGVALALKEARRRLGTTTSAEAETLLGSRVSLNGEHPFADPFFTDAFQCFGSF
jgi:CHAT domain-containing protein